LVGVNQAETTKQLQELQNQVAVADSSAAFSSAMSRYLGTHQFTFAGSAAFDFVYDRKTSINTFSVEFEPIADRAANRAPDVDFGEAILEQVVDFIRDTRGFRSSRQRMP
jgi:hypothetical protein